MNRSGFHIVILAVFFFASSLFAQRGIHKVSSYYNNWDEVQDVAIRGDYAFVTTGLSGLQVFDISDPENPEFVSSLELPLGANLIDIIHDFAYIQYDRCLYDLDHIGFSVVEIGNPNTPRYLAYRYFGADETSTITGFNIYENRLVVSTYHFHIDEQFYWIWTSRLLLFDIEHPDNPVEIFSRITCSESENWIWDVTSPLIRGNIVYLQSDYGFLVLDFSNIEEPEVLANPRFSSLPKATNNENNLVYALHTREGGGIRVIDTNNPEEPELISAFDDFGCPFDIVADDTLIYATFVDSIFGVINVADPDSPELLSELHTESQYTRFDVRDDLAVTVAGPSDFSAIDLTDIEEPEVIGTYSHPEGSLFGIDKEGDFVYVTLGEDGFSIVDVSDIDNPQEIGRIDTPGEAVEVYIKDEYAYIADGDSGLCIFDVSNIDSISLISRYIGDSNVWNVSVEGNYAYLLTGEGLSIVNITTIERPRLMCQIRRVSEIEIRGNIAFMKCIRHIDVMDISNKSDPRLLNSIGFGNVDGFLIGFKILGNYLICYLEYSCEIGHDVFLYSYIEVFDISDIYDINWEYRNLIEVGLFNWGPFYAEYDYAYIFYNGYMNIWNISNPEDMRRVGYHPIVDRCKDLVVDGSNVFITNSYNLTIYDCHEVVRVEENKYNNLYSFRLEKTHPNPFNSITTIAYQLSGPGEVSLQVFDLTGREIAMLVNGWKDAGNYQVTWNAASLPSGIYLCRLSVGERSRFSKLALVR